MRKSNDTLLLEQAYQKVLEDFNSERRLNAFAQNLQGRGFKQVYREGSANGEILVFNKAKSDDHRMSAGNRAQDVVNKAVGTRSMVSSELIFIEVDASKNFVDGYVLTTDTVAASKIVKHLANSEQVFSKLREMLDSLQAVDGDISASEMHPLKSYEDAFAQIGRRDRQYAGV